MPRFIPKPDDPMMTINIGTFHMVVNQRYLESLSSNKSRHFWAVIGNKIKEENTHGNTQKRKHATQRKS